MLYRNGVCAPASAARLYNIISADIREIEDKIYGQMLLELPDDNVQAERVCGWLEDHSIAYTKEV